MTISTEAATVRFVALTALRWLPNGLAIPVIVLLASARGLSVPEIGAVFIAHGVAVTVLELPTGGLADAIGYRSVLALSALVQMAGLLVMVAAQDVVAFVLAFALVGVGRALDSGPLEAWYVGAVHANDPGADVTRGLSLAGVADGVALAVGAVIGGVLPGLVGADGDALAVPLLVAAALDIVYFLAVLRCVTPLGPAAGSTAGALLSGAAQIPGLVQRAVSHARRDATLRVLFAIAFCLGAVLYTLEVLGPLHFAALGGSATRGSAAFGLVIALSFLAGAAGSALAIPARQLARGSSRAAIAVLLIVGAGCLVLLAAAGSVVLAAVAYCALSMSSATTGPLRRQVLHSRVPPAVRASTLSSLSLCLQAGGIAAGVSIPFLAARAGRPAAFAAAGALALLAALLALRLPGGTRDLQQPQAAQPPG